MNRHLMWAGTAVAVMLGGGAMLWGLQSHAQDGVPSALRQARAASPTPGALAQSQADWTLGREEADPADRPHMDQERAAWLSALTARDAALRAARPSVADLTMTCLPLGLMGCQVGQGGFLADGDGNLLYWQIAEGATEENGITDGIVFLVPEGEKLRPVGWAADAARYSAPVLIAEGEDFYIAASGVSAGSGSGNMDTLFRWSPGASQPLTEIDDWSWRNTLQDQLPQGLEVWQGVTWNWPEMIALTPLWRDDDGNCCATGGSAVLSFEIQGDRLVLTRANVSDAIVNAAVSTPPEVLAYVRRAQICAQWGDQANDADVPQATRDRVTAARCGALPADAVTLRRAHAGQRTVLDLIARAGSRP